MKTFKEYLLESKNIGDIYHFTNLANAWIILSDKTLLAKTDTGFDFGAGYISHGRDGVSFTRNHDLKNSALIGGDGHAWGSIRIKFDGNKLSNKYKIEPYLDRKHNVTRQANQAEEIIKKDVVKFGNTVKQVDFLLSKEWSDRVLSYENSISGEPMTDDDIDYERSDIASFIRWVRKKKIKINIVNNFKKK